MQNAYTYLIGWSKLNKWYYGCRYSKKVKSPEEDLWKKYFTSSKSVKFMRNHFNEPDVIQIRKRNLLPEQAIKLETKVLQKFNVCSNNCWINISDNAGGINPPPIHKNSIWINDGEKNKRISKKDLESYILKGWKTGRLLGKVKFYEHGNRKRNKNTGRFE